jgi:methylmalonyl-CoA/ethylmalonyl-CoA epimerase
MSADSAPGELTAIGQIALNVKDLERAIGFYRDALRIPLLFSAPGMAFFDCGGIRLMLSLPESTRFDHPSSILYFKVEDIAAAHKALTSRGVVFESPPHLVAPMRTHDLWMAFFVDSEANTLALMSEVPRPTS